MNQFLTCPDDCDEAVLLPALATDPDCDVYDLYSSQIKDLVILPKGATGPTDWTAVADWTAVVDNTATDNSKAKRLVGIGSLPVPEKTKVTLHAGKQRTRYRTFTLTFTILDVSEANYAFAQKLQCGSTQFKLWIGNESHLFGGQDGIQPFESDADLPLEEAFEETEKIVVTMVFRADGNPARTANPFA